MITKHKIIKYHWLQPHVFLIGNILTQTARIALEKPHWDSRDRQPFCFTLWCGYKDIYDLLSIRLLK